MYPPEPYVSLISTVPSSPRPVLTRGITFLIVILFLSFFYQPFGYRDVDEVFYKNAKWAVLEGVIKDCGKMFMFVLCLFCGECLVYVVCVYVCLSGLNFRGLPVEQLVGGGIM